MSDGNAHNLNNLPIIQAGSAGGYFKTGWTINVDTANPGAANMTTGNSEVAVRGWYDQRNGHWHQPEHGHRFEGGQCAHQQVLLRPDEREWA